MKKFRLSILSTSLLLLALVLVGCGNNNAENKKSINWMTSASLESLDPSKAVDVNSDQILFNAFRGLVTPDGGNKVKLAVAKDYKVSKDGKTYTFDLKKTSWSNGRALTAKDFEYAIKRSANPKTASQMAYYMANIRNYNEIKNSKKPLSSLGVKALNNYKLQIQLSKPQADFINILTLPIFYPQLKSAVDKYGSAYGTMSNKIVYNGPFKVTKWTGSNDTWNLTKNRYYYDNAQTKLNNIKYSVIKDPSTALNEYQSGKLDQTLLSGKQQYNNYKDNKDFHLRKTFTVKYLSLNQMKIPEFSNIKIRKALSLIINRNQLIHDILGDGSVVSRGMVPDTLAYHNGKDFNDYAGVTDDTSTNVNKAKQLWKAGMKELGKKSINASIMSSNDGTNKNVAEFLQSEMEKLPGMKISLELLPSNVATPRSLKSQYQISISGWDPSISDPISPLNTKYSTNPINTSKWKNNEYDKLVDRSNDQDALNPAKRWDDLVNAQKILLNDQAIIPLYQIGQPELIKSNIHDVRYLGNGPVWDFAKAYVK
ncbi:peptide ABC transporter substrate-binding protein [Apilactobacillus quenuiae]|uniref:peptide ABC transporter substrate-binding protein n=1 Tax=Apilactobacillus quenuiae TaxID=2008377 RepID=UPI000D01D6E6|nr:peptide ABC transporter substrate-binding protein [Apilactobacillus quenuiae]